MTDPVPQGETLEQFADRVVAKMRREIMDRLDDDVIGHLGESHLIFGRACVMEAISAAMREAGGRPAPAKTFQLGDGSLTSNVEGFELMRPRDMVSTAAQALGAKPADIAGLWNLDGYPELTSSMLLQIYMERL